MPTVRKEYKKLEIPNSAELLFGRCKYPVRCGNKLEIGGGSVYPEINFTLPSMTINNYNWPDVLKHYKEIAENLSIRAKALEVPGLVIEFEQLPPMTQNPKWGAEITLLLKESLNDLYNKTGIANALRVTVVDIRDLERPPILREGKAWDQTYEAFRACAEAGADILSIESVGGKEVHDQALMYGDLKGIIASMGILSSRDMAWLWDHISDIAEKHNCVSGGDTACGFSNTANCAYEGPIIKAITGVPISMEGKSWACAHFSPLGNIAGAVADLWSNESVQNIRLLSGNAPEAFLELLAYDCRLFNTALNDKNPTLLRDWLVKSDVELNVQALMLEPSVVYDIAEAIVQKTNSYERTIAAVHAAIDAIESAVVNGTTKLNTAEKNWFERLRKDMDTIPDSEDEAIQYLNESYGDHFLMKSYGL
jgi:methanol--5-hydroxybenzimidazolylcobamide Co-methyltransferase